MISMTFVVALGKEVMYLHVLQILAIKLQMHSENKLVQIHMQHTVTQIMDIEELMKIGDGVTKDIFC